MKSALVVLLLVFAGTLRAQSGEAWVSAGVSVLASGDIGTPVPDGSSGDFRLGPGFRIGLRYGYNSSGHVGHELQYAYSRSSATDSTATILPYTSRAPMAVHQMGYNIIYYLFPTEEGARVRPFLTVGVHFSDFDLPSTASPGGSSLKWGLNYGGGFKYRISSLFGLRFDVRGYDTRKPNWGGALSNQSGLLQQTEASVGFGVYF